MPPPQTFGRFTKSAKLNTAPLIISQKYKRRNVKLRGSLLSLKRLPEEKTSTGCRNTSPAGHRCSLCSDLLISSAWAQGQGHSNWSVEGLNDIKPEHIINCIQEAVCPLQRPPVTTDNRCVSPACLQSAAALVPPLCVSSTSLILRVQTLKPLRNMPGCVSYRI